MGADTVAKGVEILRAERIPQYPVPERAAKVMMEMVLYSRYKSRPLRMVDRFAVNKTPVLKVFKAYQAWQKLEIGEVDAKTILKAYNFEIPPGILASTVEEAAAFGDERGYPVVMKISSPDILHKSDVGGVKVGLNSREEVEDAFELMMIRIKKKMPEAEIRGVLVEKMVKAGREVILGMKRDTQFGPNLMFGLGGIFVEVLKDVTFGLAPITEEECHAMIESTKSYRLLTGVRGEEPVDIDAIVVCIQRMSQLVMDFPRIEEIDINPLLVGNKGDGAFVADARIILSNDERKLR
jgi:acetyltransferase